MTPHEKKIQMREALAAVDRLWTYDAKLGYQQEMEFNSPVGRVWQLVREALKP